MSAIVVYMGGLCEMKLSILTDVDEWFVRDEAVHPD